MTSGSGCLVFVRSLHEVRAAFGCDGCAVLPGCPDVQDVCLDFPSRHDSGLSAETRILCGSLRFRLLPADRWRHQPSAQSTSMSAGLFSSSAVMPHLLGACFWVIALEVVCFGGPILY